MKFPAKNEKEIEKISHSSVLSCECTLREHLATAQVHTLHQKMTQPAVKHQQHLVFLLDVQKLANTDYSTEVNTDMVTSLDWQDQCQPILSSKSQLNQDQPTLHTFCTSKKFHFNLI